MSQLLRRQVVGWITVAVSTLIACLWAVWGIIENFHEGWFYESVLKNVGLMLVQYLSPTIIFVSLTVLAIARPRLLTLLIAGAETVCAHIRSGRRSQT